MNKTVKRVIFIALLVIFIATFLISGYFLVDYMLESNRSREEFGSLAERVENIRNEQTKPTTPQDPTDPSTPDAPTEPTEPELVTVIDPETGEEVQVLPEYAEIYELNNDLVGWIKIEGTTINHPVVQTPTEKDYYLHLGFYKEYNRHGTIYVKEECDVFAPSDNIIIYGHYMKDGSMFHDLHGYTKKDYWESHKYINFDTLQERHTYEIIAVFKTTGNINGFPYYQFIDATSDVAFNEFVAKCKNMAYYDTGVNAEYGDKLITLSTCEYTLNNGRLVVVAKQIS